MENKYDEYREALITRYKYIKHAYETRWGIGRIKFLVNAVWRDKFEKQEERLAEGFNLDNEELEKRMDGMFRAYYKLQELCEEDHVPSLPESNFLEGETNDGFLFRIINDGQPQPKDNIATFWVSEIAELLSGSKLLLDVKKNFPNSRVNLAKVELTDDAIPF